MRWESFRRFTAAYLSLKKQKGRGPGKIPWRAASGPWAVGCRPPDYRVTKQSKKSAPRLCNQVNCPHWETSNTKSKMQKSKRSQIKSLNIIQQFTQPHKLCNRATEAVNRNGTRFFYHDLNGSFFLMNYQNCLRIWGFNLRLPSLIYMRYLCVYSKPSF